MTTSFFISKNATNYSLLLTSPGQMLLQSVSPFLKGFTMNPSYTKAIFNANSVLPLLIYMETHKLSIKIIEEIIINLTNQLYYLSKNYNYTFYRYNPEYILVIDYSQFIYVASDDLRYINHNNEITFSSPFCKEHFTSPEIKLISSIPSNINAKSIYYSLGLLIIYLLQYYFVINNDKIVSTNEKLNNLPIKYSKLYWFLLKLINIQPEKRQLLFI